MFHWKKIFYASHFRCETKCNGTFGESCKSLCQCNPNNTEICDHVDGTCTCLHGWNGELCERACQDGDSAAMSMTVPCSITCNCTHGQGICQPSTGQCL